MYGLDNRRQTEPSSVIGNPIKSPSEKPKTGRNYYDIKNIISAYGFPTNLDGSGQCIGMIHLGGGYVTEDLHRYFADLGLNTPDLTSISVDGVQNSPSENNLDAHVATSIEVVGTVASGAKLVVYKLL